MNKTVKSLSVYLLITLIIAAVAAYMFRPPEQRKTSFSELVLAINAGSVTELEINDNTCVATINGVKTEVEAKRDMLYALCGEAIAAQINAGTLAVTNPKPETVSWWVSVIPYLIISLIPIAFLIYFMRQQTGGKGGIGGFAKSHAKVDDEKSPRVTFDDVAGADEEKQELQEIVEFLKNPRKFIDLGARIPKGVLLIGPPGTGKTLLAKAIAGEAKVPFFSISGSDFVEMFVGVGASRVRDLFDQARKNLPAIIFIDEIDAVGRQRGTGLGGGHDEREQTLNQLLVEMDGFSPNEGIIMIAATNRPDILDPALLRPGRFDRQVVVNYPDQKGREAILRVHAKNKPIDESSVSLEKIAKTTYGFTGADLENLLNEAAILAARAGKDKITMTEMDEAMLKTVIGPEKKSSKHTEKDKKQTAYHEAGHAVITRLLPTQDPVHQVSIIPRGRAGGFTLNLPDHDKAYINKQTMLDYIVVTMAGRVSEKIVFGEINTGASGDLTQATKTAREMVMQYGMSEKLGCVSFDSGNHNVFLGRDFSEGRSYSESVAAEIDAEIKRIIDESYARCEKLLRENMPRLESVAAALIEHEKLDGDEFEAAFTAPDRAAEEAAPSSGKSEE